MNPTTENYLKSIFTLSRLHPEGVSTTSLAAKMNMQAPSVTDMLKKLDERGLVKHTKYKGCLLTAKGKKVAIEVIRKHRLWEVFLVEKLHFAWDQVHEIAEQLEHVQSEDLIERMDSFLGFPRYDPHGDPIPDAKGNIDDQRNVAPLSTIQEGRSFRIEGLKESSDEFLRYLEQIQIHLFMDGKVVEHFSFDHSIKLRFKKNEIIVSDRVAENLLVTKK